ncbi:MAG TPA: hypothetical protein VKR61_23735 [Bryobacteraceae bacterium]|nr:hypothetical protein [Bryobacteraceae bacterium]
MKHSLNVAALALLSVLAARAQSTDNTALQALLAEVHQLRLMVEKSVSLGPRMELLLKRAQMQDQKVARIAQQLDEVRKQIAGETARQASDAERLAKIEQDLSIETDAEHRKQLEEVRAGLKMAAGNGPDPQLRAREGELARSLQTEQALLDELNGKLDGIERQLESLPAR